VPAVFRRGPWLVLKRSAPVVLLAAAAKLVFDGIRAWLRHGAAVSVSREQPAPTEDTSQPIDEESASASSEVLSGSLSGVLVAQAVGLVGMGLAGGFARSDHSSVGEAAFWLGVLCIVAPTIWCVAKPTSNRAERLIAVTGLGFSAYLAKVLIWPIQFTFHDEFTHWRTASDIVASHHLFSPNPLTPVSSLYPGSEAMTAAVAQLSGLSLFVSGLIVVGVARVVLMLAIFLVFERVSGSTRAAGLASVLYAGNPNFFIFDAQFSYESVAIPLAAFVLYLALRRPSGRSRLSLGDIIALAVGAAALAMTHHLTSWIFSAGFAVAALIAWTTSAGKR
jgi:hypothetical protein